MNRILLHHLVEATGGRAVGCDGSHVEFARVEIDSRGIRSGDLFWALRGAQHDGHDFIEDAQRRGAVACVCREDQVASRSGRLVAVGDTLAALGNFARWHRRRHSATVVAVTGSFGKTTTREMIFAALGAGFSVVRSPNNFNNHVGLPLSLLGIEPQHEFAVVELGASAVGEIRALAAIATPEIGVVTGIGPAHLETFGSIERVVDAKAELLEALPHDGLAVIPGDDSFAGRLTERTWSRIISVGQQRQNNIVATDVVAGNQQLDFRVSGQAFTICATGRHHLNAALAAIAVGRESGLTDQQIAAGLRQFAGAPGRSQFEQIGPWHVIDDTYNANPESTLAACKTLSGYDGGNRKLLVMGDMLELGHKSAEYHHRAGQQAAHCGIDHVLAQGRWAEHVVRGATDRGIATDRVAVCDSIDATLETLQHWLEPGDVVLVKGSRGMHMEQVVDWLRQQATPSFMGETYAGATAHTEVNHV